jgi:hypothetical protein
VHYGSVYLWYDTASQRERPGGYSTTAPRPAKRVFNRLERLNCGDWTDGRPAEVAGLGVRAIALHLGLYGDEDRATEAWFAWQGLLANGWNVQRTAGPVWLFERRPARSVPSLREPPGHAPIFCVGWYDERNGGRNMSETHAALWVYGTRPVRLRFAPTLFRPRVRIHPGPGKWRLVTVDVEHLHRDAGVRPRVGARLLGLQR